MGDPSLISGSGRSPGGGHSNPLQYSCLENPMDRGAWRAIVRGFTESETHSTHNFIPHLQPFSLEAKIDKGVKIYPWLGFFLCKRINQRIEKQLFRVRSRGDHVSVKWRCPLMTGNLTLSGSGLALSANLSFPSAELRARSHCGQSVPSVFQMAAGKQTCESFKESSPIYRQSKEIAGAGGLLPLKQPCGLWFGAGHPGVRLGDHSFVSCRNLLLHSCRVEVASSCSPGVLLWLPSLLSTWLNTWSCRILKTSTPASLSSLPGYSQVAWYKQLWVARQRCCEVFVCYVSV